MQLVEPRLERRDPIAGRLDYELLLAGLLDISLPPIDRRHDRQDVHARGEAFVDKDARKCGGIGRRAKRRQDDYRRGIRG